MSARGIEGPYGLWDVHIASVKGVHAPIKVRRTSQRSDWSTDTCPVHILDARDARGMWIGDAYKDGDTNMQEALQWFADLVGARLDLQVEVAT